MPRVPTYDSPQVRSQGLPGVGVQTRGVNIGAFGGEQAEMAGQLSRVADVVTDQLVKAREQRDVADAMDATDKLFSEAQAKQQELSKRMGKDADGVKEEMAKWHEEKRAELGSGLSDRAYKLYERKAKQIALRDDSWADDHYTRQMDNYYDVKVKTDVENSYTSALYDPKPETISQSIATAHENYKDMAHRKGYDEAWVTSQTQEFQSKLHGGILQNAIDQDAVGSVQSYLKQYGDSIDPGMRGKAEKWVHNKQIDETAGAYADGLLSSGVSLSDALSGVREKFTGDDEDAYVRKVKELYGEREHQKNLYVKDQVDAFEKMAYKQGVDKLTDEQLDNMAQYDAGTALKWKTARDEALDLKAAGGAFAKHSKPAVIAEVNSRLMSDESDKITKPEQLSRYRPFLSESDYNSFEKSIEKSKVVSESDIKEAYLIGAPKDKRTNLEKKENWKEEDYNDYFTFRKAAIDQVKDNSDPESLRYLSAKLWRNGTLKGSGWFYDDSSTGIRAISEGKADQWEPEGSVPRNAITEAGFKAIERTAERQALEAQAEKILRDNGKLVTPESIQRLADQMKVAK